MANDQNETAPATASDTTTQPPASDPSSDAAALAQIVQQRRRDLGVRPAAAPPKPKFALPPEPTAEELAAREKRAAEAELRRDAEREYERKRKLSEAWRAVVGERGQRYAEARLSNYTVYDQRQQEAVGRVKAFCEAMASHHSEGRGLVFYGPCGTGKDHLLVAALRQAVFAHGYAPVWVNGMELFGEIRDAIGGDRTESSLLRRYVTADVLAISDPLPPFGGLSEYQATMLFRIIDGRYSRMLPTWATVNVKDGAEADTRMGAQIVDRLRHGATCIDCRWPTFRKPEANK